MKTFNTLIMVAALAMAPVAANAQWSAVRFDSSNTFSNVYAATPNDVFVLGTEPVNGEYFMLRTADGGTTWDSIALNSGMNQFQMFEIYFPDVNNGFIGGRKNNATQSLRKTTDNGTTWTDVTPEPTSIETISSIYFLDAQTGWATSGFNLYTTSNGGSTWTTSVLGFLPQDIYFVDATTGYACGGNAFSTPAVVMKTTDGGQTWNEVLSNYDANLFVSTNAFLNVVDANTIFTAQQWTNKLFRTTNAGATWDTIVCDSAFEVIDFHFNSADSGQVLTSMGQIYYTNDAGATWALAYATQWGFYGPSVYLYSLDFAQGVGYVCGSNGLVKRFDANLSSVGEHHSSQGTLKVYPNPCYQYQNVRILCEGLTGDCDVTVYNTLGEIVYTDQVKDVQTLYYIELKEVSFLSGLYTVEVTNGTQKQTSEFIISE